MDKKILKKIKRKSRKQLNKDNHVYPMMMHSLTNNDNYKFLRDFVDKDKIKNNHELIKIMKRYDISFPKTIFKFNSMGELTFGEIPDNKVVIVKSNAASMNTFTINTNLLTPKKLKQIYRKFSKDINYGKNWMELQYKNIELVCFAEEIVAKDPNDFKVFMFDDGSFFGIDNQKNKERRTLFNDKLSDNIPYITPRFSKKPDNPYKISDLTNEQKNAMMKMKSFSEEVHDKLLRQHCRYDFYFENNQIYLGELTFTTSAGIDVNFNGDKYYLNKFLHNYAKTNNARGYMEGLSFKKN